MKAQCVFSMMKEGRTEVQNETREADGGPTTKRVVIRSYQLSITKKFLQYFKQESNILIYIFKL